MLLIYKYFIHSIIAGLVEINAICICVAQDSTENSAHVIFFSLQITSKLDRLDRYAARPRALVSAVVVCVHSTYGRRTDCRSSKLSAGWRSANCPDSRHTR